MSLPSPPAVVARTVEAPASGDTFVTLAAIEPTPEGVAVRGVLATESQEVRVPVRLTRRATLNAYVDGRGRIDPVLAVFDAQGRTIAYGDDTRGLDPQVQVTLGPGEYVLHVGAYSHADAMLGLTGPFRLLVWTSA